MSDINGNTTVEFKQIAEAPGIRIGLDASIWSSWRSGSSEPIWPWRRMKPKAAKSGYYKVTIRFNGRRRPVGVHQLVCMAFHGPKPPGMQVRHLDGDKSNNLPDNVIWGTCLENHGDQIRHGTKPRGTRQHSAKMTPSKVMEARRLHYEDGIGNNPLARRFGVTRRTIQKILRGITWRHLLPDFAELRTELALDTVHSMVANGEFKVTKGFAAKHEEILTPA